jgi:hypothetical protein
VRFELRPLLLSQDNNCDTTACEILLVTHILIGRQQYVEPGSLCCSQQIAIAELVPTLLCGSADRVLFGDMDASAGAWLDRK